MAFENGCMFGEVDMKKCKTGEKIAASLYQQNGFTVYDVSDVKEYQGIDVDFLMVKDDDVLKVECKYNSCVANNKFILENILDKEKNLDGWIWYTDADVLTFACKSRMFLLYKDDAKEYLYKCLNNEKGYYAYFTEQVDSPEQNKYFAGRIAEIAIINITTFKKKGYEVYEYKVTEKDGSYEFEYVPDMDKSAW